MNKVINASTNQSKEINEILDSIYVNTCSNSVIAADYSDDIVCNLISITAIKKSKAHTILITMPKAGSPREFYTLSTVRRFNEALK